MSTKIFVNLPVKDLQQSISFFTGLGYSINQQFTDEKAACLVISEHIYAMLLTEPFFKTFTRKELADTATTTEVILALSAESRNAVDTIADKAVTLGAAAKDPQDHGFMYTRSFQDPDGHEWEVFWMDPEYVHQDTAAAHN